MKHNRSRSRTTWWHHNTPVRRRIVICCCFLHQAYKKAKGYPPSTYVEMVNDGSESAVFKQLFQKWTVKGQTTGMGSTNTVGKIGQQKKILIMFLAINGSLKWLCVDFKFLCSQGRADKVRCHVHACQAWHRCPAEDGGRRVWWSRGQEFMRKKTIKELISSEMFVHVVQILHWIKQLADFWVSVLQPFKHAPSSGHCVYNLYDYTGKDPPIASTSVWEFNLYFSGLRCGRFRTMSWCPWIKGGWGTFMVAIVTSSYINMKSAANCSTCFISGRYVQ